MIISNGGISKGTCVVNVDVFVVVVVSPHTHALTRLIAHNQIISSF